MRLALDSNVFIAYLHADDVFFNSAKQKLEQLDTGKDTAVFSTITFGEVMYGAVSTESLDDVRSFFSELSNFDAIAATEEICLLAAELRLRYLSLKLPDAIHLATAIVSKADILITADKKLFTIASNEIKTELLKPTRE